MTITLLSALLVGFPLLGAVFTVVFGQWVPRRVVEVVSCVVPLASLLSLLLLFAQYQGPVAVEELSWLKDFDLKAPLTFYLDPLSLSLALMITTVCWLIHLYSVAYMADEPDYRRYFSLLNLFLSAMLLLVLAENLPLLYLGWEGVGFCSYALIGFWYQNPENASAGRKAFLVTRIGDTGLGIAMVWLFAATGAVSIPLINQGAAGLPSGVLIAIGLLLLVGAAGKSAQLPLSVWLPDAMAGPTPVSAMIHAATMVTAGVYLLIRLFPVVSASAWVLGSIAAVGAVTAFYAASCACAQSDLKRILAYSTISQVGYMMLGVGVGAPIAATFHLLSHAFFKGLLFLAAGSVIMAVHHQQDIFRMGGLKGRIPNVYRLFLAGVLCLAGIPLTSGFFSKDAILVAVFEKGGGYHWMLFLLGGITAAVTAFYSFRMLLLVFHGEGYQRVKPLSTLQIWPMVPLALLALAGGLLDLPAFLAGDGILHQWLKGVESGGLVKQHLALLPELMLELAITLLVLCGAGVAWFRYGGQQRGASMAAEQAGSPLLRFLQNGWYLDQLYDRGLVRPFLWLSSFVSQGLDRLLSEVVVSGTGRAAGGLGLLLASTSTGRVAGSLLGVAAGLLLMLGWLLWSSWI